ncbi:MAG: IS4 family transposase, partial [Cyanobacteria bacterium P01_A01_bin.123]
KKPPTLRQAMLWIAQLGGFLARKGDGEPGLKTLWRGLTKLHTLMEGAQLAAET